MKSIALALWLLVILAMVAGCAVPTPPAPGQTPPAEPEPIETEVVEEPKLSVVPPGSTVAGKTIGEWSAEWWKWAYSHSVPEDPFTDTTGEFATLRQEGPVFYMAQTALGENLSPEFTIPAGKYILISVIAAGFSQAEVGAESREEELRNVAQENADMFTDVYVILDGEEVPNIAEYRERSPVFEFEGAPNNVYVEFGGPEGESGMAVSDGYFVMLEPPEPGSTHKIEFGAAMPEFGFETINALTVTISEE